jgi:hypothetical protein
MAVTLATRRAPGVDLPLDLADRHLGAALVQHRHDLLGLVAPGEGGADEVVLDVGVLGAAQQDPEGLVDRPPGPADLLVVGHRRARALVVHDEGEVGLVEAHPEGGGGDDDLHPVGQQGLLERDPVVALALARVGGGVDALRAEPARHPLGVGDREAVHDPRARQRRHDRGQPGEALGLRRQVDDGERQARPVERAAHHLEVVAQLVDDVGHDPVVGGGRRAQHRHVGREHLEDAGDAAVVGAEVVAPVADAVGLVDDEEAEGAQELGEDVGAEPGVVQPLRRDQQQVDLARPDPRLDLVPVVGVVAVDRGGPHAGPFGHRELVAHEGEQRRHEHRGARALVAPEAGGDEVDGALAPAGALHDEHPPPPLDQPLDRLPLAGPELGVGPAGEPHQQRVCVLAPTLGTGHAQHPTEGV